MAWFSGTAISSHTQRHAQDMGTRNIAISDEAYERLKALKKPGESFTEVIERMTRSRGVLDLAGILSPPQTDRAEGRVRELREESSRRLKRTAGGLG